MFLIGLSIRENGSIYTKFTLSSPPWTSQLSTADGLLVMHFARLILRLSLHLCLVYSLSICLPFCSSVPLSRCQSSSFLCRFFSLYSFFFILTSSFLFHCQSSSYPISYVASSRFWLSILSSRTASLTHCLPDFPILSFSCLCVRAVLYPLLTPFLTFSVSLSVLLPFV